MVWDYGLYLMNNLTETAQKNLQQTIGAGHPYTCGYCRDNFGTYFRFEYQAPLVGYGKIIQIGWQELDKYRDQGYQILTHEWELVATQTNWLCPTCGYTQEF